MSFGSGDTSKTPTVDQKALGLDPRKLPTNEQARPVPVSYGTQRLGVTHLSAGFNRSHKGVKQTASDKAPDIIVGYNYFIGFAALVGCGPFESINEIWLDEELAWSGPIFRDKTLRAVNVKILKAGSGYNSPKPFTQPVNGGTGTGATVKVYTHEGQVTWAEVTGGGTGHTVDYEVPVTLGGGSGAKLLIGVGEEPFTTIDLDAIGSTWRFYWGTETQDFDSFLRVLSPDPKRNPEGLEDDDPAEEHPAYSGQSYIAAKVHGLGYQRTNIQVPEIVATRIPNGDFLGQVGALVANDANMVHCIVDAMMDRRYGLAMSRDIFDASGMFSTAVLLSGYASFGVSPFFTKSVEFRQVLIQMLEYFDAFATTTEEGWFTVGLAREVPCGNYLKLSSAAVNAGGTGYHVTDLLAVSGGIYTERAILLVTSVSGSGAILSVGINKFGIYSEVPVNPSVVVGIGSDGAGATFDLTFGAQGAAVIDENCLTELPRIKPSGYADMHNLIHVIFTNGANGYKEDSRPGRHIANYQIVAKANSLVLQRPWITVPYFADITARHAADIESIPKFSGSIKVRKSRLQGLKIGDGFILSYPPLGLCNKLCRVQQLGWAKAFEAIVDIDFEGDRSHTLDTGYAVPASIPPSVLEKPPIENITVQKLFELPFTMMHQEKPAIVALAAPPNKWTIATEVNIDKGSYILAFVTALFAQHGLLNADMTAASPDNGETIDLVTDGPFGELQEISAEQGAADLYWALVDDELLSILEPTLVEVLEDGRNRYTVKVNRERADTKRDFHGVGSEVFILPSAAFMQLGFVTDYQNEAGETNTVKLVPHDRYDQAGDITESTPMAIIYSDRSKRPWKSRGLIVNGTVWWDGPATHISGTDMSISWQPNNREKLVGDLPYATGFGSDMWFLEFRLLGDLDDYPLTTGWRLLLTYGGNTSAVVVLGSSILTAVGTESFILRAYAKQKGFVSRYYDEITVNII